MYMLWLTFLAHYVHLPVMWLRLRHNFVCCGLKLQAKRTKCSLSVAGNSPDEPYSAPSTDAATPAETTRHMSPYLIPSTEINTQDGVDVYEEVDSPTAIDVNYYYSNPDDAQEI